MSSEEKRKADMERTMEVLEESLIGLKREGVECEMAMTMIGEFLINVSISNLGYRFIEVFLSVLVEEVTNRKRAEFSGSDKWLM